MLRAAEMDISQNSNYVLKIAGIDYFFLDRNESLPLFAVHRTILMSFLGKE